MAIRYFKKIKIKIKLPKNKTKKILEEKVLLQINPKKMLHQRTAPIYFCLPKFSQTSCAELLTMT